MNVVEQSQQKQRELEEKALMLDDMPHLEVAYTNRETNSTCDPKREESDGIQQGNTTLKNNDLVEDLSDDLELFALDLVRNDSFIVQTNHYNEGALVSKGLIYMSQSFYLAKNFGRYV